MEGHTGYTVDTYKTVTENGESYTEWFSTSYYMASADKVRVGPKKNESNNSSATKPSESMEPEDSEESEESSEEVQESLPSQESIPSQESSMPQDSDTTQDAEVHAEQSVPAADETFDQGFEE